jgi:hypothetical protein
VNIQPIFVIGNRRSGSTLLRLMLTSHKNIAIPPEGGFIWVLGWKYDHLRVINQHHLQRFVDDLFMLGNTQDWKLDRESLIHHLGELVPCTFPQIIDGVYNEYVNRKFPGKVRWGDKTTGYVNYLDQTNRYFPNAQFIHLLRDGRAVVASYKNVPHLSNNVRDAALDWVWSLKKIIDFGRKIGPEKFIEIKYEDLVREPERELNQLCEFLNEPFDSNMMNFWMMNREEQLEPERHLGWKALTLEKVTTKRVSEWEVELSESEIQIFDAIAGDMNTKLGYGSISESDLPLYDAIEVLIAPITHSANQKLKKNLRPIKARMLYELNKRS